VTSPDQSPVMADEREKREDNKSINLGKIMDV
jgi:hypothetical protein